MEARTGTIDLRRNVKDVYVARLTKDRRLLPIPFSSDVNDTLAVDPPRRAACVLQHEQFAELDAPDAGNVSLAQFFDSYLAIEFLDPSGLGEHALVYMTVLTGEPEGTEDFFLEAISRPVEAPVDWDRWHDLLDIRAQRALTTSEEQEYEEYARIAAQLDAEEGRAADAALDNLVKEHERVIASIRRLTAAVRAAAEQH